MISVLVAILLVLIQCVLFSRFRSDLSRELRLSVSERSDLETKTHDLQVAQELIRNMGMSLDGARHMIEALNFTTENLRADIQVLKIDNLEKDRVIAHLRDLQEARSEEKVFN